MDLSRAWDATTPVWHLLQSGPKALDFPSAFSADGQTMVTFRSGVPAYGDPASSWLYSVQTNQWSYSKIQVAAPNLGGLFPVTDPTTGLVYVAGGYNTDNNQTLTQMLVYQFDTDSITALTMPANGLIDNLFYRGVWWPQGKSILYFGGYVTSGTLNASQITQFVPSTNTWSTLTVKNAGPPAVASFCMAIAEDGSKLVVFGGKLAATPNIWTGDLYVLDLNTLLWKQGQGYSSHRTFAGCTVVGNSTFVAWGGYDESQTVSSSAIIYDLGSNTYLSRYTPPGSPTNLPSTVSPSTPGGSTTPDAIDAAKTSNSGPWIGGVVGGCAGIALIVGAFLLGRRRKSPSITSVSGDDLVMDNKDHHQQQQQHEAIELSALPVANKRENQSAPAVTMHRETQSAPTVTMNRAQEALCPRGPQLYPYNSQNPQQHDKNFAPSFSSAPQVFPRLINDHQQIAAGGQVGSPQFPAFYDMTQTASGTVISPQFLAYSQGTQKA
ncbi:hypothetical protein BGX26_005326 [Mortierella sp. AD094]|nr:hypothetical protein BGX26_005326 [Mortierella sp. AD094]